MRTIKKIICGGVLLTPFMALAAQDIESLIDKILGIINLVIPLLIAVAVVIFLYGVVKYITAGASEESRKEARSVMLYGIIGLFVMVAVWGLVNVLVETFNLDTNIPMVPEIPRY
jgi:heme/copper-type cytochrome/quinol oxidase subunit 2